MNQQMHLLEARAMAREREHQLQLDLHRVADHRRHARRAADRRLSLALLGRHREDRTTSGRATRAATARG